VDFDYCICFVTVHRLLVISIQQGLMADEFTKTFSSVQEEIEYWKSLCMKYKERLLRNYCC